VNVLVIALVLFLSASPSRILAAPEAHRTSTSSPYKAAIPVPSSAPVTGIVSLIKDLANIAFFIVVGTVTVLTYKKAKRTILQPIRTEVFKQQLQLFSDILALFVGKSEHELRRDLAYDQIIRANAFWVVDAYARDVFGHTPDEQTRPYRKEECPVTRLTFDPEMAEMAFDPEGNMTIIERPQAWAEFCLMFMKIHKKHTEATKSFARFLESPLVPSALGALLTEFSAAVDANVDAIHAAVEEYARQLPQRFPTAQSLAGQEIAAPVINSFNRKSYQLKPIADRITAYIRSYFEVERLLEA